MIITLEPGVKELIGDLADLGMDVFAFSHHIIFSYKGQEGNKYGFLYLNENLEWHLAFTRTLYRVDDIHEMMVTAKLAIEEFREKHPSLEFHMRDSMRMIATAREGKYDYTENVDEVFEVVLPNAHVAGGVV